MTPLATLQAWLSEAEAALHKLNTGTSVVKIDYQGTASVTFNAANQDALVAYIGDLKRQIAEQQGQRSRRGPIHLSF
jgi:hypothetical protein